MTGRQRIKISRRGLTDYSRVWQEMKTFTGARQSATPDELWILQHKPVYTLGRNGRKEHLLDAGGIPVVQTDRGGQITYHGPGQVVVYTLVDLHRRHMGVRQLVDALQDAVMETLADYHIESHSRANAPGVYVNGAKIAALGLRVTRGCAYHGLALNIDMDLTPFDHIDPCGYRGMQVTQLGALTKDTSQATDRLIAHLCTRLGYPETEEAVDASRGMDQRVMAG
jgi:lipoyl(octanoyl) transferase